MSGSRMSDKEVSQGDGTARLIALVEQWRSNAQTVRADRWCNTNDAPIWRSIHAHRADEIEKCADELEAVLRDAAAPTTTDDAEVVRRLRALSPATVAAVEQDVRRDAAAPPRQPAWVCDCGHQQMRIDGQPHCANCGATVFYRGPWETADLPRQSSAEHAPNDLGLSVDMLDVDRLRSWASLIEIHGNDISHWSQRTFVIEWLREFAGRLETVVREIGLLRQRDAAAVVSAPEPPPVEPAK